MEQREERKSQFSVNFEDSRKNVRKDILLLSLLRFYMKHCTKSKNAKDWRCALAIRKIRYVTRLHGFLHKSLRSRVTYPFGHMAC